MFFRAQQKIAQMLPGSENYDKTIFRFNETGKITLVGTMPLHKMELLHACVFGLFDSVRSYKTENTFFAKHPHIVQLCIQFKQTRSWYGQLVQCAS